MRRFARTRWMVSVVLFSCALMATAYTMTRIARSGYPLSNYLFLCVVPVLFVGWLFRRQLRASGLYVAFLASHVLAVFLLSSNRRSFALYAALALAVPIGIFLFMRRYDLVYLRRGGLHAAGKSLAAGVLVLIFVTALVGDLLYSARQSRFLYGGQPHLRTLMHADTNPTRPVFPRERYTFPMSWYTTTSHTLRYVSLLNRQAFVFSPVDPSEEAYAHAIESGGPLESGFLMNGSFERWMLEPEEPSSGRQLPAFFSYEQAGTGGRLRREGRAPYARDGRFSAAISPSSRGYSMLRQRVKTLDPVKGRILRLSVSVKSDNRTPDAIQIDVQTNDRTLIVQSYGNSGGWEELRAVTYVPPEAEDIILTLNVAPGATAEAFFDDARLQVSPVDYLRDPVGFEMALRSRRSSSLMLKRSYAELIHLDVPARLKSQLFAVGQPLLQLRQGLVEIADTVIEPSLRGMDVAEAEALLRAFAIVEPGAGRFAEERGVLIAWDVPSAATAPRADVCGRHPIEVTAYTYDTLELRVQSDAPCVLYWADGYDRRWRASVNGEPTPILRANINFKAVVIPAGRSDIRFEYAPTLFKVGVAVFYTALGTCVAGAILSALLSSRQPHV